MLEVLEALEVFEVTVVMCCVLLCVLEAVEGEHCLLEVVEWTQFARGAGG